MLTFHSKQASGDYVGHRSASSTQIYGKIAIEQLREVALGDGEDAWTRQLGGFLAPDIDQFLAHKRSLGRRYDVEKKTLALFDAYFVNGRVGGLHELKLRRVWTNSCSRAHGRARGVIITCAVQLGRLFSYLVDHGKLTETPLRSPPRRARYQRTPFIFDEAAEAAAYACEDPAQ